MLLALGGCAGQDQRAEVAQPGPAREKTLYVAPLKGLCQGVGLQQCLLVRESPSDRWLAYYSNIDGFYFEEGFQYELRVAAVKRDNPPDDAPDFAYQLLEEMSKTLDPTGGTEVMEDLLTARVWRLDSFTQGTFEEPALLVPEVSLEFGIDGRIRGSAGCNQYFGDYLLKEAQGILMGGMGSTQMSCPEPEVNRQEVRYLEALGAANRLEVGPRLLRLYHGVGDRALNFQTQ
jgi:heat shock protein HslJ